MSRDVGLCRSHVAPYPCFSNQRRLWAPRCFIQVDPNTRQIKRVAHVVLKAHAWASVANGQREREAKCPTNFWRDLNWYLSEIGLLCKVFKSLRDIMAASRTLVCTVIFLLLLINGWFDTACWLWDCSRLLLYLFLATISGQRWHCHTYTWISQVLHKRFVVFMVVEIRY